MKTLNRIVVSSVLATFVIACADNGGAPTSSLSMQVDNNTSAKATIGGVFNAPTGPVTFTDNTTTFTITEARMHIRDIRFDSDAGDRYTVNGPYVMNLLDGTASPSNIVFDAPAANYVRVDIRLDEANIGEGLLVDGDQLLNNALIIKGTHDYNGVTDGTFTLTVKVTEDIRFEPVGGIVVGSDTGADMLLTYKVTDWLENSSAPGTMIDLSSCVTANGLMDPTNNHIALDEGTQCTGIAESIGNLIKNNMKNKYDLSSQ